MLKSSLIQLKSQNQFNPNQKLIKITKVWIGLDLVFHKLNELDRIWDLIFKIDPTQSKPNNIIQYNFFINKFIIFTYNDFNLLHNFFFIYVSFLLK